MIAALYRDEQHEGNQEPDRRPPADDDAERRHDEDDERGTDLGSGVERDPAETVARQLGRQEGVLAEQVGDVEPHGDGPQQDRQTDDDTFERERPRRAALGEESTTCAVERVTCSHRSSSHS